MYANVCLMYALNLIREIREAYTLYAFEAYMITGLPYIWMECIAHYAYSLGWAMLECLFLGG